MRDIVEEGVQDIEVGDRVACGGADYAVHSDIIAVPRNLVAKIPDGVSMEQAFDQFLEQRAHGFDVWGEPFVELRLPKLYTLRGDPFERASHDSVLYDYWRFERAGAIFPPGSTVANVDVGGLSATEARDVIGGTWSLFRYPGIRSDSDMHTLGYPFRPWTQRKAIAEPVNGQIKEGRGFRRFLLRGLEKVNREWALMATTHNILKLFRASLATG